MQQMSRRKRLMLSGREAPQAPTTEGHKMQYVIIQTRTPTSKMSTNCRTALVRFCRASAAQTLTYEVRCDFALRVYPGATTMSKQVFERFEFFTHSV